MFRSEPPYVGCYQRRGVRHCRRRVSPRVPLAGFSASTSRFTVCQRERVKADRPRTTVCRWRERPSGSSASARARPWARGGRPGGCRLPAFRRRAASNCPARPIRRTSPGPGPSWLPGAARQRGTPEPVPSARGGSATGGRCSPAHWCSRAPVSAVGCGGRSDSRKRSSARNSSMRLARAPSQAVRVPCHHAREGGDVHRGSGTACDRRRSLASTGR